MGFARVATDSEVMPGFELRLHWKNYYKEAVFWRPIMFVDIWSRAVVHIWLIRRKIHKQQGRNKCQKSGDG